MKLNPSKRLCNLTFESCFSITNKSMLINRSHPSIKRDVTWVLHFGAGMVLTWFMEFLLFNAILSFDIPSGDILGAGKHATMAVLGLVISFKYLILLKYQADSKKLIETINLDFERAKSMSIEEQAIVRSFAERGEFVTKLWLFVAGSTSSLFPLKASFLMIYYAACGNFRRVMVFEVQLPFVEEIKYDDEIYMPFFVMCTVYAMYAATLFVSFDPLVPIAMLHACGQLELVKVQIKQLCPDGAYDPSEMKRKISDIVQNIQRVYSFIEMTRSDFTIVYEIIAKASTIVLPLSGLLIIEELKIGSASLEFVSLSFGSLVHFYVPCYYSDLLMEKSVSIMEAVYACGWEMHWDPAARKSFLLIMMRANKPLAMTTAFDVMCLDSFSNMCRQSYSIFNLMNAGIK